MDFDIDTHFIFAFGICVAAAFASLLGGLFVILSREPSPRLLAFGLAFAGGAMVYVSMIEIVGKSQTSFGALFDPKTAYIYTTLAFFAGIAALTLLDNVIPKPHDMILSEVSEAAQIKRVGVFAAIAITAHNLPEGLATFLATLDNPVIGMSLAVAIAIHNIPEGISIAIPVYFATGSRKKAIIATGLSALAEPAGAMIGYVLLAPFLGPLIFAIVFGMIAGAMVFLALDELLPTAKRYAKGHETVYGIMGGMGMLATSLILFK